MASWASTKADAIGSSPRPKRAERWRNPRCGTGFTRRPWGSTLTGIRFIRTRSNPSTAGARWAITARSMAGGSFGRAGFDGRLSGSGGA